MRDTRPRLDPKLYMGLRRYFLTFCAAQRCPVFVDDATVEPVLRQILQAASAFDVETIAYCFMPDHVHLLIEGTTDTADARAFVHRAKQTSGYAFAAKNEGRRLWQPSYYDRVLRDEESTLSVARYTLENPVRAGLVASPADYPFSGSIRYLVEEIMAAAGWQPSDRAGHRWQP